MFKNSSAALTIHWMSKIYWICVKKFVLLSSARSQNIYKIHWALQLHSCEKRRQNCSRIREKDENFKISTMNETFFFAKVKLLRSLENFWKLHKIIHLMGNKASKQMSRFLRNPFVCLFVCQLNALQNREWDRFINFCCRFCRSDGSRQSPLGHIRYSRIPRVLL